MAPTLGACAFRTAIQRRADVRRAVCRADVRRAVGVGTSPTQYCCLRSRGVMVGQWRAVAAAIASACCTIVVGAPAGAHGPQTVPCTFNKPFRAWTGHAAQCQPGAQVKCKTSSDCADLPGACCPHYGPGVGSCTLLLNTPCSLASHITFKKETGLLGWRR